MLNFLTLKYLFADLVFFPEVLEEWATQTSRDDGLKTERAALEKLETHTTYQEQVTFSRRDFFY